MYTLLSGFYNYLTRKEEYYVLIIGLDNAGKTTLLERIKSIFMGIAGLDPDKIAPTVGLNIGKVDIKSSRINFWDLGGQKDLQSIWERYYSECHAIVFVVDSTDPVRLEECRDTFGINVVVAVAQGEKINNHDILEKMITNDAVEGVPVLMLANKQDINGALRVEQVKEVFNKIAMKLGARDSRVLPVSALEGNGVEDAIDWLVLRLQRNKVNRPPVFR